MKRKFLRGSMNILLPSMAALAVVIATVKIWNVPASKVYDTLTSALTLLVAMVLLGFLAFLVIMAIKTLQKWLKK